MEIQLAELREITNRVFDHLAEIGVKSVSLDQDYYWSVPLDSVYDVLHDPDQLEIGQLTDDWSELRRIANGEQDPLAYHLVWLSSVYRYIGETIVR